MAFNRERCWIDHPVGGEKVPKGKLFYPDRGTNLEELKTDEAPVIESYCATIEVLYPTNEIIYRPHVEMKHLEYICSLLLCFSPFVIEGFASMKYFSAFRPNLPRLRVLSAKKASTYKPSAGSATATSSIPEICCVSKCVSYNPKHQLESTLCGD